MHKIKDRKRKQSTPDKREKFKQKEAKPRPSEEEGKNELIFVILQKKKKNPISLERHSFPNSVRYY